MTLNSHSRALPNAFVPAFLILFLCLTTVGFGQPVFDVQTQTAPVNTLSISDVDFVNSTTPKWLFTVNIRVLDGSTRSATMEINASFMFPDETRSVVLLVTEPFPVMGTRTVTNLDLGRTIPLVTHTVDQVSKRRLEETALPSGTLPAGVYSFAVTVRDSTSTSGATFQIVISNPSTVQLLSPVDGDSFVNPFPLFQWQYDGPSSRISVFEKLPGQNSLEEAASGIPHLSATVQAKSFQYPSSGARILEPGKTYVWFVEGLVGTSGGTVAALKSELRSFVVAGSGGSSLSSLLDELERALPQYQSLFDQIRAQGLTPSGSIRLNGTAVSIGELMNLLNRFRIDPEAVTTAELQ